MNLQKLRKLVECLRLQDAENPSAIEETLRLNISLEDGYCLFNLYEQWLGAFSFLPGRKEAVLPLLSLAEKLTKFSSDDTLAMYSLSEWQQLVLLRGPVETVLFEKCTNCSHSYVSMGTSGFYDANGLVCDSCGNVYFKSYYDETPPPRCACGREFPSVTTYGCRQCGEKKSLSQGGVSPYEYFSKHTYIRGPGA
jgi:hypothetical protein